jgi:hypothetical protein
MTPTGTNLLGLIKHLAASENQWFCETFGRPAENMHVIEDTARHAGHMDILRELIDGQAGDRPQQ